MELTDHMIYDTCEWWKVSFWSDKSFYKAIEKVFSF